MDTDDLASRAAGLAAEFSIGLDGRHGRDGRDGVDGKSVDPALVEEMVARAVADMPRPRDGIDADPELIRAEVERAVARLTLKDGERGPEGPPGPVGPAPLHEWHGTKLRFQQPDGKWGEFVDLRGPRGQNGAGGGAAQPVRVNSYMPGGWQ